jgi:hypothetical protein
VTARRLCDRTSIVSSEANGASSGGDDAEMA